MDGGRDNAGDYKVARGEVGEASRDTETERSRKIRPFCLWAFLVQEVLWGCFSFSFGLEMSSVWEPFIY